MLKYDELIHVINMLLLWNLSSRDSAVVFSGGKCIPLFLFSAMFVQLKCQWPFIYFDVATTRVGEEIHGVAGNTNF